MFPLLIQNMVMKLCYHSDVKSICYSNTWDSRLLHRVRNVFSVSAEVFIIHLSQKLLLFTIITRMDMAVVVRPSRGVKLMQHCNPIGYWIFQCYNGTVLVFTDFFRYFYSINLNLNFELFTNLIFLIWISLPIDTIINIKNVTHISISISNNFILINHVVAFLDEYYSHLFFLVIFAV